MTSEIILKSPWRDCEEPKPMALEGCVKVVVKTGKEGS